MTKILKSGLAFALVACVVAFSVSPAQASMTVTYTTTASVNGLPVSPGTSPVTLATGVTFTGVTNDSVTLGTILNNTSSVASFGTFDTSGVTGAMLADLNGKTFTLYITQTTPAPSGSGLQTFDTTLVGQIVATASTAFVNFTAPLTQVIATGLGPVTYSVPSQVAISPPSTNGGITTLQGQISAAPEPSTVLAALSALPILGLGLWRRRGK